MRLSTKTKHYHRERVRSVLVQNPQISGEGLRQRLEQQGLILDRHYISSLVNAIHAERAKRASTWMLNHALASLQDQMSEIVKAAWEIVNDPMARNMDKTLAMKEISEKPRSERALSLRASYVSKNESGGGFWSWLGCSCILLGRGQ